MRIFLSAGEPSGDVHGANLARALRARVPNVELEGFGGDRMQSAGTELLYPLVELAIMGFSQVAPNLLKFAKLLSHADRHFREHRPDAVVLIDYPGFHWWVARRAHAHGIPVFYFVPPQLWAWAGWRVKKMKRYVDHVLCTLPFEKAWYEERGVAAHYVGHPFFDELPQQILDTGFMDEQRRRGGDIVALLPGSRTQEVERNLSTLIRGAHDMHRIRPSTRFLVASFKPQQQAMVDAYLSRHPGAPIETHVGRTPEILSLARACAAVSGSVSLELLYRGLPSVIVYRANPLSLLAASFLKKVPYICLVNLLAGKVLYPEFLSPYRESDAVARHLLRWLNDASVHRAAQEDLSKLCSEVARPGACGRAADYVLDALARPNYRRAA